MGPAYREESPEREPSEEVRSQPSPEASEHGHRYHPTMEPTLGSEEMLGNASGNAASARSAQQQGVREWVNGKEFVSPPPTPTQEKAARYIQAQLIEQLERTGAARVFSAPGLVELSPNDVLRPDICVVSLDRPQSSDLRSTAGPPDLIVEVLGSSGGDWVRQQKRAAYARAGVRVFWVVDVELRVVEVYTHRRTASTRSVNRGRSDGAGGHGAGGPRSAFMARIGAWVSRKSRRVERELRHTGTEEERVGVTLGGHYAVVRLTKLWRQVEEDEAVEYPIDGELDLHLFQPKEVKDLVPEYLRACLDRGIYEVRVVHGKGKGVLAKTVHAVLERLEIVERFHVDWGSRGSWGATRVYLKDEDGT